MTRLRKISIGLGVAFVAMQLVRCSKDNPPVTGEIAAPAPVQAIFERSCYDCHSNETRWPWYSQVAPVSWLVNYDVVEGREHLNFSTWAELTPEKRAHKREEIGEHVVEKGDMPMPYYLPLHPEARLSDADKQAVKAWAEAKE
jgi:hypothetical protein